MVIVVGDGGGGGGGPVCAWSPCVCVCVCVCVSAPIAIPSRLTGEFLVKFVVSWWNGGWSGWWMASKAIALSGPLRCAFFHSLRLVCCNFRIESRSFQQQVVAFEGGGGGEQGGGRESLVCRKASVIGLFANLLWQGRARSVLGGEVPLKWRLSLCPWSS